MDAYDELVERKRETCRFWGYFELMFVHMLRPQGVWMCDLTDERNPDCYGCGRYEPKRYRHKTRTKKKEKR
jgi:hypothetical protein